MRMVVRAASGLLLLTSLAVFATIVSEASQPTPITPQSFARSSIYVCGS